MLGRIRMAQAQRESLDGMPLPRDVLPALEALVD
jgi:hypothetical protein